MSYPQIANLPAFMQNYQQILSSYTEPFVRAWRHRELIRAVARREYLSRYSGAALGWIWAVLAPLFVLGTYTFLFYFTVPELRGNQAVSDYAASIFIGLIVFNLFSELGYRAPMLLHEHVNFVKRSIFPSDGSVAHHRSQKALHRTQGFVFSLLPFPQPKGGAAGNRILPSV